MHLAVHQAAQPRAVPVPVAAHSGRGSSSSMAGPTADEIASSRSPASPAGGPPRVLHVRARSLLWHARDGERFL